ncbi:MAG: acyltransferase family protein [Bacillota bacterium]
MGFSPFKRSLASYAAEPENNYLIMRFVAALLVIYGHSYSVTRFKGQYDLVQRLLRFTYAGGVGVDVFFVISGFLVTASYLNRRNWGDFMKARVLRIFPALIVCMLATVLLFGPVVSTLSPMQYFANPQVYLHFLRNITLFDLDYQLPGVFEHLPQYGVNGSLWTLPVEFGLYVLLGLFGLLGLVFSRRFYLPLMVLLCAAAVFLGHEIHLVPKEGDYVRLCILFAAGSTLRVYSDRVPLSGFILVALAVPAIVAYRSTAFPVFFSLWLVYAVMWIAYMPHLNWFNRAGDYSYGLYIYAFPIQQALREYFPSIQPLEVFASASLLTLACAALSWHFVEEPALKLKGVSLRELSLRLMRQPPARTPEQ